jgi:hypothetical protein
MDNIPTGRPANDASLVDDELLSTVAIDRSGIVDDDEVPPLIGFPTGDDGTCFS